MKAVKAIEKHKERMMKKNTGTPIAMKKVVNVEFKKEPMYMNPEQVARFMQPSSRKVDGTKEVKISLK